MTDNSTATPTPVYSTPAVPVQSVRDVRCPMCGTLAFKVIDGAYIEIRQRHHGEQHQWIIPIAELMSQAK